MKSKRLKGGTTDNTDLSVLVKTVINTLEDRLIPDIPIDIVLDPKTSNFTYREASLLNKYHNYFWSEDQHNENWQQVLSIFDDYCHLREKALASSKLNQNDFNNLLSEENLMFLHRMMTTSFLDPAKYIESGIDDFELTFRIPVEWQKQINTELKAHPEIKRAHHYANEGYRKLYGHSKKYHFSTGGTFVFHRNKFSSSKGDCLISFRLSETPWRNIKIFFNCIYNALGDNYEEFHTTATVIRKDPYFLIKGIPSLMMLVDTSSTNNGKPIKRETFVDIENWIHGSHYYGDRRASHTIVYDMYPKFMDLIFNKKTNKVKKRYKQLFKEASSLHCITKVERRIVTHQQGRESGLIKDMDKLRGHTFDKLEFYSPLLFTAISPTIAKKIFRYGFASVKKQLSPKQLGAFNQALSEPQFKLYLNYQPIVEKIESDLAKLQRIIQKPQMLNQTISL